MKAKSVSVFMVLAAVIIIGFGVSGLEASQYLGEVTWTYSGGGTIKAGLSKAGLSKAGGSYYEVQGQAVTPNGTVIFSGGGALVGTTLMLSAAGTQVETNNKGTYHNANTLQINVDQSTFNGTMWIVTNWYNPAFTPPFGQSYDTGTLTLVGQKPSLAPATAAQTLLLQ
ncbi:MAG: hypothetical protein ACYDIC_15225 [Desulfobaccales bacterium]